MSFEIRCALVRRRTVASRYCLSLAFGLLLSACGGGGGSSDSPGSGGSLAITPTTLSFSAEQNGAVPSPQGITTTYTEPSVAKVVAGYPPGTTPPTWLDLTFTGAASPLTLNVIPTTTALPHGTHTATIRIATLAANDALISVRDATVTYQVGGLSILPSSVNLTAFEGTPSAVVPVSVSRVLGSASWTTSISYSGATTGWLTVSPSSGATLPATLNFSGDALPAGTYTANVTINAAGFSIPIPVTYVVSPNLGVNPTSVSFDAVNGQASLPAAANVTVSTASGAMTYTASIAYGPGAAGWLNASGTAAPGTLTLSPNTTNLATGATYTATVTLTPSGGDTPVNVDVSYTVTAVALTLAPASQSFTIDNSSTSADAFLKRTVTTGDTGAALTWTASSSMPWLTVTASGTSGDTATLALVPAQMGAMPNGASSATVTFTYVGPGVVSATKTLDVTLNLNLAKVNYVAPYVGYVNEQKEVIIRGSGFSQSGLPEVMFGSTPAQSIDIRSDTEIRAVPPLFSTGARHEVSIANNLAIDRSRADFLVRAKPVHAFAAVPANIGIQSTHVIYDAERDAVLSSRPHFGIDPGNLSTVNRFSFSSGVWSVATQTFTQLFDIAMSPDGTELLVLCMGVLHRVDPVTLAINSSVNLPTGGVLTSSSELAAMNDGKVIILNFGQAYSLVDNSFAPVSYPAARFGVDASLDGSRAVTGYPTNAGDVPLSYYDASTGLVQATATFRYYATGSLDRSGSKLLLNSEVFNQNFVSQGLLTQGSSFALSPDGNRAYSISYLGNDDVNLVVNDVSSPPTFPEVATITYTTPNRPGVTRGVVSLDNSTVFLVGQNVFIVQPVP